MDEVKLRKNHQKQIRRQMEFYLSDANLSKDRSMFSIYHQSVAAGGIPLEIFLNCNRLKALISSTTDIVDSLETSKVLQVVEGKVSRKLPFQHRSNQDECTVYVENLPAFATPEWCRKQLRYYGKVVYVAMPKFRNTENPKGYAFVEFDTVEEAENYVAVAQEEGWYIGDRNPNQLLSVKTFEGDEPYEKVARLMPEQEENQNVGEPTNGHLEEALAEKTKEVATEDTVDQSVSYVSKLKVLSRRDWKKQRNTYLNEQKKEIIAHKRHLWFQRMKEGRRKRAEYATAEASAEPIEKGQVDDLCFDKGTILKISLSEVITDAKAIKDQIRALGGVKYVDVMTGAIELKVRCEDAEAASRLVKNPVGNAIILTGAEELDYWRQIFRDRDAKNSKSNPNPPEKTKKKKTANKKQRQHIHFGDAEESGET